MHFGHPRSGRPRKFRKTGSNARLCAPARMTAHPGKDEIGLPPQVRFNLPGHRGRRQRLFPILRRGFPGLENHFYYYSKKRGNRRFPFPSAISKHNPKSGTAAYFNIISRRAIFRFDSRGDESLDEKSPSFRSLVQKLIQKIPACFLRRIQAGICGIPRLTKRSGNRFLEQSAHLPASQPRHGHFPEVATEAGSCTAGNSPDSRRSETSFSNWGMLIC